MTASILSISMNGNRRINIQINWTTTTLQYFSISSNSICEFILYYLSDMLARTIVLIVLPLLVLSAITPLNLTDLSTKELNKHNQYRKKYGYSALKLNTTLVTVAQNYSNYLYNTLAKTFPSNLVHSTPAISGKYGENLFWKWSSSSKFTYVGESASTVWYSESANYANYKSKNGGEIGHFTAMIWKSVKTVGFGFYQGNQTGQGYNGQGIFVVANYYPTPNVGGQQKANLPQYA